MISVVRKFWEQQAFICVFLTKPMYFNIWTESNRKERGRDFITGYGYIMESLGGLQKKDIDFYL